MASGSNLNQEEVDVGDPSLSWHSSPLLASAIRAAAFLLPLIGSWILISLVSTAFYHPEGGFGLALWVVQAVLIGMAAAWAIGRFSRRLLPVAALFRTSLVFPRRAPSRLRLGLQRRSRQPVPILTADEAEDVELAQAQDCAETAISLLAALSSHDRLNEGHSERVRTYADLIAEEMGLSQQDRIRLSWGALVHDLGKLEIPSGILNKDEKPTEPELKAVTKHPAEAETLLAPLAVWLGPWMGAVTEHHEHWDGSGYPAGLGGIRISLAGRITAVADAYDTMTSPSSYKTAIDPEEASDELKACSGTQFDADVVRAFLRVPLDRRAVAGPSSFPANLPPVGSVRLGAASAVAAVALVAATFGTGIPTSPVDASPIDLAFADEPTDDEEDSPNDSTAETDTPQTTPNVSSGASFSPPALAVEIDPEAMGASPSSSIAPGSTTTSPETSVEGTASTTATTTALTQPSTTRPADSSSTTRPEATTQPTQTTQATTNTTQATTTTAPPPPVAYDDNVEVKTRKRTKIYVLENDNGNGSAFDPATLTIITPPEHASQYVVVDGLVAYRPTNGYAGPDSLQYQICTYAGACDTAWVSITVVD